MCTGVCWVVEGRGGESCPFLQNHECACVWRRSSLSRVKRTYLCGSHSANTIHRPTLTRIMRFRRVRVSFFLCRDALSGFEVHVRTLDGRPLRVPVTEVVTPTSVKVVSGEGMPLSKTPGRKGDLRIK